MTTPEWLMPRSIPTRPVRPAPVSYSEPPKLRQHGIDHIERVMTDNAWAYRRRNACRQALDDLGARSVFTRSYRPNTNGKADVSTAPCSRNGRLMTLGHVEPADRELLELLPMATVVHRVEGVRAW
jgi:hypothetical protein